MNRKVLKERAKTTAERHYWLLVVLCLFAAFLGAEYTSAMWAVNYSASPSFIETTDAGDTASTTSTTSTTSKDWANVVMDVLFGDASSSQAPGAAQETNPMLGRSRGVFAGVVNTVSNGSILRSVAEAVHSIVHSRGAGVVVAVLLSLAVYLFVWLFIRETYLVVSRRMALEARVYEQVPMRHMMFPIRTRQWPRIAWTMFIQNMFLTLWWLTIVGGIIKSFSYRLVPYIIAENPSMKACDAISLSRRMMKGHKWEAFVAFLSFLGWNLLAWLTLGISGIFYSNGYQAAFWAEYYTYLRALAKQQNIEGTQRLNDEYLFVAPSPELLASTYADVAEHINEVDASGTTVSKPTGFAGFLCEWLGIRLTHSQQVTDWETYKANMTALHAARAILDGKTYPNRLAPSQRQHPNQRKPNSGSLLDAMRSYSVLNLTMMFFIFCFIGWLWEVALAFITEGHFVNRGTLHGPWLPIYGMGGIIILVVLKKLRDKPLLEFVAAVVLCGALEYYVSWYLEMTHGQRWWDYTGYFLNLNGRICAEGLLTFGLGGLAIVYLLAPALDQLLNHANRKILAVVAIALVVVYVGDQIYSGQHPNAGHGITDYKGETTSQTK